MEAANEAHIDPQIIAERKNIKDLAARKEVMQLQRKLFEKSDAWVFND